MIQHSILVAPVCGDGKIYLKTLAAFSILMESPPVMVAGSSIWEMSVNPKLGISNNPKSPTERVIPGSASID